MDKLQSGALKLANPKLNNFGFDSKRTKESYPKDIKEAAYLLAFNPDKMLFYGSQAKKPFYLSSGDIDLIEQVNIKKAGELAKKFYQIILNIEAKPDCYLGDVKSGVDEYYVFDYGTIKDGKWVKEDPPDKLKLFKERKTLKELWKKGTPEAFFDFEEIVRKYQILRWNADELKRGFKVIRGEKVPLEDTIKDVDSMTKIDTIQYVPSLNRYVEVTNYFFISRGKDEFNELSYIHDLKLNLFKNYCQKKYFKMVKRMLTFTMLKKDKKATEDLYKIVNGGLGIAYQCLSELDAIDYVLEHYGYDGKMSEQIDGMKYRLANIWEFKLDETALDKAIERITMVHNDADLMGKRLKDLQEAIGDFINHNTHRLLKELGYLPLPQVFIP